MMTNPSYERITEIFALSPPTAPDLSDIQKIRMLEAVMRERLGDTSAEIEGMTSHHFAPGVYLREMRIPEGHIAVGKTHRHDHISILLEGEVTICTDEGMRRLTSPQIIYSKAGIKRAAYAHTETRWLCIHPNEEDETNMDILESKYIEPEPLWTLESIQKLENKS